MIKQSGSIVNAEFFKCEVCEVPLVATRTMIAARHAAFDRAAFKFMTCPDSLRHQGLVPIPDIFATKGYRDELHFAHKNYSVMPSSGIAYAVEFMHNSVKPYTPRRFISTDGSCGFIRFFSDKRIAQGWVDWYENRRKECRVVVFTPAVVCTKSLQTHVGMG